MHPGRIKINPNIKIRKYKWYNVHEDWLESTFGVEVPFSCPGGQWRFMSSRVMGFPGHQIILYIHHNKVCGDY